MLPCNSVGWQPVAELEIFNLHHHGNIFVARVAVVY